MNILVTGGAGFIGSNFIRYWLSKYPKDKIINYDKLTYAGNLKSTKDFKNSNNYTFVKGNITNAQKVEKVIVEHKVNLIVHFAAESHVDRSIVGPSEFIKTNIVGTQVLLDAVRKFGNIHFHHVSTDEVFGSLQLGSNEKFIEQSPYKPNSPYSASKAASDHLVRAYHGTYKIPVTISNCSNNYGPYQNIEKLIPLVISRAIRGLEIPVYGDGKQVRDWIYVDDHNRGIDLIIKKGKVGETYLLGGDSEKANIDVVKTILKVAGRLDDLILYVTDRKGHDKRYSIDFTKAKKELGFKPEKGFEVWLEDTVNWYIQNREWWEGMIESSDEQVKRYLSQSK